MVMTTSAKFKALDDYCEHPTMRCKKCPMCSKDYDCELAGVEETDIAVIDKLFDKVYRMDKMRMDEILEMANQSAH